MRKLEDHIVSGDQAVQLTVKVVDEPGAGGASHEYQIFGAHTQKSGPDFSVTLHFQNGPIKEAGVNGITQEVLLAIVIDRLRSFQSGPFSCRENAIAITKLEESLMWLQRRTIARLRRGVEGTNQK
jgi:hypothetical protein